jgi:pimeloyl-ACP methyl ester carboxylesterase
MGPEIQVSVTFNLDGSVAGIVSEPAPSTNTFSFSFASRTIQSTGDNFSIETDCNPSGTVHPRFDDVTIRSEPSTSKRPVVIIPGIMGSELDRTDNNDLVWLDTLSLVEPNDSFLFPLLLKEDGAMPDANSRCAASKQICTTNFDCVFPDFCAAGGTTISPNGPLNIPFVYTAYNDLANFLRGNGYTGGTNLFTVGYDWRLDLIAEAQGFHERLFGENGLFPNPTDKVDIIAHSMGGLLLRAYLKLYPDDQRIVNAIYLGTPQRGAPLAYAKLIGAASLVDKFDGQIFLLNLDTETFLTQNFPTAYALLPRDKFVLINSSNGIAFEPLKTSFARLSNPMLVDKANDLHTSGLAGPDRVLRSFGINGTQHRTLEGLNYTDPSCPKGFSDPTGDGTVPSLSSGGFLDPSAYLYINEEHKNLPGNVAVQQQILNIFNGQENVLATGIFSSTHPDSDGWSWFSCSPIRTHITDEAGHINGLDSEGNLHEEIEGSSHFRFPKNEGGFFPFEETYAVTIEAIDNGLFQSCPICRALI